MTIKLANKNKFAILCVSILNFSSFNAQIIGQSCIVENTQLPGICKLIRECPSAIDDIRNRRRPTRCGFQGRQEIVCCQSEIEKPITPSPRPITSNSRISERKCDEYKSAVYENISSISLAFGSSSSVISKDKCGHTAVPLIVGGEFAKPREFPHMALVGFTVENTNVVRWACGGSLISEEYVLTAGHCLYTEDFGEPKYVRLGDLNVVKEDDDAQPENFEIVQIIPHPNYRRSSKYNDIGLLKLDHRVKLNSYKRPACLPTSFDGPEMSVIATGWGHTTWAGRASDHLQKVVLQKFTQEECNETYSLSTDRRLRNGIQPSQICAGSKNASKDTCQGDSGGPIQVYHPSIYCMYTIVGVTSFGKACGNVGVPGVYTRVYEYLDWIESVVWGRN